MGTWASAGRRSLAALAAALAGMAAQAAPDQSIWIGPNFGSWFDVANWDQGVPGAGTVVLIDGRVVSAPNGAPALAGAVVVGLNGNRPLGGLGMATSLSADTMIVGLGAGSNGLVTVGAQGSVTLDSGGLLIGTEGKGTVEVTGGRMSSWGAVQVGIGAGSDGTLRVNGGRLTTATSLEIGLLGHGALSIEGGAMLVGIPSVLTVGRDGGGGGTGEFRVAGAGSYAALRSVYGRAGGSVKVEDGGTLDAPRVHAGASSWSVRAGGTVLSDQYFLMEGTSRLGFTLEDRGAGGAGQLRTDFFTRSGTLSVALAEGFVPSLGDSWQLMAWGGAEGTFDRLELPALSTGLRWDESTLVDSGMLRVTVVPEPASALLFGAGLAVLCGLRRGRHAALNLLKR